MISGVALSTVTWSASTRAQSAGNVVHVDYVASVDCPGANSFIEQLRTRSRRTRVTDGAERAQTLVIRMAQRNRQWVGRLTVRDVDGTEAMRSVAADTCSDVVAGLALIAAVAVDPLAMTTPSPVTEDDAGVATPAGPSPDGARSANANREAATVTTPLMRATPATPTTAPVVGSGGRWEVALGTHVELVSGVSPNVLVSIPVYAEVSHVTEKGFAPSARVRVDRAGSGIVHAGAGDAHFTWTAGSLEACPVAWPLATVRLTACVRAEAGILEATGLNVQPSRDQARPWLALGPVARGRWVFLGPFHLELEGALFAPVIRDRFFLQPSTTVFQAPIVGFSASLGVGASIW